MRKPQDSGEAVIHVGRPPYFAHFWKRGERPTNATCLLTTIRMGMLDDQKESPSNLTGLSVYLCI